MSGWPILSLTTFLPLAGVLFILFVRDDGEAARRNIRHIALWATVATFVGGRMITWQGLMQI